MNWDLFDSAAKEQGLSRRKIALLSGVCPSTLGSAYRRKSGVMNVEDAIRIAKTLGIRYNDFCGVNGDDVHYESESPSLKYMIAIPCMDYMTTEFVAALTYMRRVGPTRVSFLSNTLVYDARSMLAAEAIDTGADRVLWLDSDMKFSPALMEKMAADMDTGLDYVSGLCFRRRTPVVPIISDRIDAYTDEKGKFAAKVGTYFDYPKDQLFEIAASGFGAVMCTTKMLKNVYDNFGNPFDPFPSVMGEDYAFCYRAGQLGYKMYCDSRIKVGHVGQMVYGEHLYTRPEENHAEG